MHKMTNQYSKLLIMAILSFISMYVLMYMMVDEFANVYSNWNQFYMAGMMTAPMIIIELLLMGAMYPRKNINIFIIIFSFMLLILFIYFIREQTGISNKQFLKSMIPHHAGALLMCEKASVSDAEIQNLCRTIISSQESEINWMKTKLSRLNK